jgi:DNA-directed RNA polymerase subunit beta'
LVLPISQSSSSSDIVQGLPKIEQLFEARSKNENTAATKGPAKPVRPSVPEGHSRASASEQSGASLLPNEAPRVGKKASGERAKLTKGPSVVLGSEAVRSLGASPASPHQPPTSLLKAELRNLQKRLIQEIQAVYNSQGVEIADKHLEIIVRQMTSRIRILEKGNTPFFPEDIVEFFGQQETGLSSSQTTLGNESCGDEALLRSPGEVESGERSSSSRELRLERGSLALRSSNLRSPSPKNVQSLTEIPAYEWVLLGITKVALLATTESYISAASFQETKRVLMSSALQSRVDFFEGLKENVIVGRIIPAGTGYNNA